MKTFQMLAKCSIALLIGLSMMAAAAGTHVMAQEDMHPATPLAVPEGSQVIEVSLVDYAVNLPTTMFQVNQTYTFVVHNDSLSQVHEFVIEPFGADDEPLEANDHEAETDHMQPGETEVLTWTFTDSGKFQVACHHMDHAQLGMVQQINVEPQ